MTLSGGKLGKKDAHKWEKLVEVITESWDAVESAYNDYDAAKDDANKAEAAEKAYLTSVSVYKLAVEEAESFAQNVTEAMRDYYGEKSEKWQEGERGDAYQSMIDSWESLDGTEVEDLEKSDDGDGGKSYDLPESFVDLFTDVLMEPEA